MAEVFRQEQDRIRRVAPLSKYSSSLAEIIAACSKGSWNLYQYTITTLHEGAGPHHIDIGYNLYCGSLGNRKPIAKVALSIAEFQDKDIQDLLENFAADNRCFMIHIAAALDISPLQLKTDMVKNALPVPGAGPASTNTVLLFFSVF